jgi:hypothetical protein
MIKKFLYVSSISLSLLLLLLYHPLVSESEEIYKWVDEKGTIHFADSLSQVPPKYRNQFETKASQEGVKSAASPNSQKKNTSEPTEPPAVTLKRFKVPYKAYEGRARSIIIPVTFNGSVTVPMLLDTGATDTYISLNLAVRLGLFKKQHGKVIVEVGGIGGSVPAILTIIDKVSVRDAEAKCVPAMINITHVFSHAFEGLVGMDFMGNYNIHIDRRKHIVTFEEMPSKSDMAGGHDETWWRYNFRIFSSQRAYWKNYLDKLQKVSMQTSEIKWRKRVAKHLYNEANKLYRKLEHYARWNSVPTHWRR